MNTCVCLCSGRIASDRDLHGWMGDGGKEVDRVVWRGGVDGVHDGVEGNSRGG